MKRLLIMVLFTGVGVCGIMLNWSCQATNSSPTFANALQTIVPTPCGYPGNTCTPTFTFTTTFTQTPSPTVTATPTPTP
jgi:hypothetical protein